MLDKHVIGYSMYEALQYIAACLICGIFFLFFLSFFFSSLFSKLPENHGYLGLETASSVVKLKGNTLKLPRCMKLARALTHYCLLEECLC